MRKKKILFISDIYPNIYNHSDGIYIKNRINLLNQTKYLHADMLVLNNVLYSKQIRRHSDYLTDNHEVFVLNYAKHSYRGLFKYCSRRLFEIYTRYNYDIIHAQFGYPSGLVCYILNQLADIDYTITFHGSDIHTYPFINPHFYKQMKKISETARISIFVSNYLLGISKKLGYQVNGIVINNFKDMREFNILDINQCRNVTGIEKKNYLVGFVGHLEKVKGIDTFLEMIQTNRKHNNIGYIIIGDGTYAGRVKHFIENNPSKYIKWYRSNIPNKDMQYFYNMMDMLVIPSRNEGAPNNAMLEALSCGTPVLMSHHLLSRQLQNSYGILSSPQENMPNLNLLEIMEKISLKNINKEKVSEITKQYSPHKYMGKIKKVYTEF